MLLGWILNTINYCCLWNSLFSFTYPQQCCWQLIIYFMISPDDTTLPSRRKDNQHIIFDSYHTSNIMNRGYIYVKVKWSSNRWKQRPGSNTSDGRYSISWRDPQLTMDTRHKHLLQQHRVFLARNIVWSESLVEQLRAQGLLSDYMVKDIEVRQSRLAFNAQSGVRRDNFD